MIGQDNCQAMVQVQVQALVPTDPPSGIKVPQKREKEGFGPGADTKTTWATSISFQLEGEGSR